jgi:ribosomal protein S18 acetylase RimI-like enzyme
MDFRLQAATPDDDTFLAELFHDVRSPEFASLPAAVAGPLLEMQHRAQLRAYAEKFPTAGNQIVWIEGHRAGRLLVSHTAEELHLVDVALLSPFRGQGVGTQLVAELCRKARAEDLPLRLSVQAGNPARRLYERMGFVSTGSDGMYIAMELDAPAALEPEPVAGDAQPQPPAVAEEGLSQAYFRSLLGKAVDVRTMGGVQTVLTVENVQPLETARGPAVELGDSFRIEFTGPLEPIVPPETVEITVPGQTPQLLFLSPLGPLKGRMQYEAIFNRSRMEHVDS